MFEDEDCDEWRPQTFKGECKILDQPTPDYDLKEPFELDEHYNGDMRKKLKIDNNPNSLLTALQTEVLFVNQFVLIFVVALVTVLTIIIIHDKCF